MGYTFYPASGRTRFPRTRPKAPRIRTQQLPHRSPYPTYAEIRANPRLDLKQGKPVEHANEENREGQ